MGREIRRVPLNWEHPTYNSEGKFDGGKSFIPLLDSSYEKEAEEYTNNLKAWENNTHTDLIEDPSLKDSYPYYWEWAGEPPVRNNFRPEWTADNPPIGFQVYENVSEGTPVSPVFASVDSLKDWLYAQGYSKPAIDMFVEQGFAMSLIVDNGHIYYDIESCGAFKKC